MSFATEEEVEAYLVDQLMIHTTYDPSDIDMLRLRRHCFKKTEHGWVERDGGVTDDRVEQSLI